jgi:hypothetical protein
LRMLRQGFAAGGDGRRDLLVRVHVLPGLRGHEARGTLPELRRQSGATPDPASRKARKQPAVNAARFQAARLRGSRTPDLSVRVGSGRLAQPPFGKSRWQNLFFCKTTPCKVAAARPGSGFRSTLLASAPAQIRPCLNLSPSNQD